MKIYFVRHGETEYNITRRLSGHTDIPLTEKGIEQAEAAVLGMPEDLSEIYSSDLIRCKQTTDILNRKLHLPVTYDARLRERDFGSLCGKHWKDFDADGVLHEKDRKLEYDYHQFGGESVEDVKKRVTAVIDDMRRKKGNILAVTSAGVIRLLHHVLNNELHETIHNSSIHEFEFPEYK